MNRRSMMALAIVVITTAACVNDVIEEPPAPDLAISGTVLVGPQCPVVREDSPCPDRPWEGTVRVSDAGGTVTEVLTDANGEFAISVDPGTYDVEPVVDGPGFARPERVTVTEGAVVEVTLTVDSGIR